MTIPLHDPAPALLPAPDREAFDQAHEVPGRRVLRSQGEEIRNELAEADPKQTEIADLRIKLASANLTEAATRAVNQELRRLERLPRQTGYYQWSLAYIEQLLGRPRHTASSQGFYLGNARCGSCGPDRSDKTQH